MWVVVIRKTQCLKSHTQTHTHTHTRGSNNSLNMQQTKKSNNHFKGLALLHRLESRNYFYLPHIQVKMNPCNTHTHSL